MGIKCSLNCHNITFEDNEVYNNHGDGISFDRNTTNSVARYNNVINETQCIFISQSHNNEIYNNTVIDCKHYGIHIFDGSIKNNIYNNTIMNSAKGLYVNDNASENVFRSNRVVNCTRNQH